MESHRRPSPMICVVQICHGVTIFWLQASRSLVESLLAEVIQKSGMFSESVGTQEDTTYNSPLDRFEVVIPLSSLAPLQRYDFVRNRAECKGGGRKPWPQNKGLGKARAGSIRAPQFKGGVSRVLCSDFSASKFEAEMRSEHGTSQEKILVFAFCSGGKCFGPRGPYSYFFMLPLNVRVHGLRVALSVKLAQVCRTFKKGNGFLCV